MLRRADPGLRFARDAGDIAAYAATSIVPGGEAADAAEAAEAAEATEEAVETAELATRAADTSDHAAEEGTDAAGIIYRRTDLSGGKPYIGQAKSDARFLARQAEHARANPDADFEFEIIGRANPGTEPDRLEEYYIRQGGGPTNLGNPDGWLANLRHQMSDSRYADAGGDYGP